MNKKNIIIGAAAGTGVIGLIVGLAMKAHKYKKTCYEACEITDEALCALREYKKLNDRCLEVADKAVRLAAGEFDYLDEDYDFPDEDIDDDYEDDFDDEEDED